MVREVGSKMIGGEWGREHKPEGENEVRVRFVE